MEFFGDVHNHRYIIGALFILGGVLHFLFPVKYLQVMPSYIPKPKAMVLWSGVAEIAGGLGLMIPMVQTLAGWGLIALLIAIFPANWEMFRKAFTSKKRPALTILLFFRLPLQLVLIYWVFVAAGLHFS